MLKHEKNNILYNIVIKSTKLIIKKNKNIKETP